MVVSNIFYFHPYLEKMPNLTNIFQMGWNHQLDPFSCAFDVSFRDGKGNPLGNGIIWAENHWHLIPCTWIYRDVSESPVFVLMFQRCETPLEEECLSFMEQWPKNIWWFSLYWNLRSPKKKLWKTMMMHCVLDSYQPISILESHCFVLNTTDGFLFAIYIPAISIQKVPPGLVVMAWSLIMWFAKDSVRILRLDKTIRNSIGSNGVYHNYLGTWQKSSLKIDR